MTASKEKILRVCEYCGKSFYASKSTTRYCSKQCNSYAYPDFVIVSPKSPRQRV